MPRKATKDKRRQQLIDATIESIAKRGLTETTITHISKGAGMSRGIINFYFDSKEKMMQECLQHLLAEKDAVWQETLLGGETPEQKLSLLIETHFDKKLCQPKRLNALTAFWGHAASHKAYSQMIAESDDAWLNTVAALWQSATGGEFFKANLFATRLHALIRGLWLSFLLNPTQEQRLSFAQQCQSFADEQLLAGGAAPAMPKPTSRRPANDGQMDIEDLFAVHTQ